MRKKISLLAIFIAFLAFFGLYNVKAEVDTPLLNMVEGASIRTIGDQGQGLKFQATFDETLLGDERGFFVIYGQATIAQLEAELAKANPGDTIYLNGKDVKVANSFNETSTTISVVLTGIPVNGYNQSITVIGYSYSQGSYNFAPSSVTRSVAQVALKAAEAGDTSVASVIEALNDSFYKYQINSDGNLEITKGMQDEEGNYIDLSIYSLVKFGSSFKLPEVEKLGYKHTGYLLDDELFNTGSDFLVVDEYLLLPQFTPLKEKIKLIVESADTQVVLVVNENYEMIVTIPKGATVDAGMVTITLEMTDIAGLGIVGTRSQSFTIGTGITGQVSVDLEDFIADLLALDDATISGTFFGLNNAEYTLSRANTEEANVWVFTPTDVEAVRSSWQSLIEYVEVKTYEVDDSQIFIPKGSYLIAGNKKLLFVEDLELINITGDLAATEAAIRAAITLVDADEATNQLELLVMEGARLRLGQSELIITDNIKVEINGLDIEVADLSNMLVSFQQSSSIEVMILNALTTLNSFAKGLDGQSVTINVVKVEIN